MKNHPYSCTCCIPSKKFTRSDVLYKHRKKYDPNFVSYDDILLKVHQDYENDPKRCGREDCHNAIPFKERSKQKYCSSSCSAIVSNAREEDRLKRQNSLRKFYGNKPNGKNCEICSQLLHRRQSRFCSLECSKKSEKSYHDNRREKKISDWLNGIGGSHRTGELATFVRNYLLRKADYKCSRCGWSERNPTTGKVPLQIDHIDGNWKNNVVDNLDVLCPNCHSLTATYGALNYGKGRTYRIDRMNRGNSDDKP